MSIMYLDHSNDFRKPHMARGSFMYNGMAVVVSPNVPPFHAGDELVPVWPWYRRVYRWLLRREPTPLRYSAGPGIYEDQAFISQGKIFMPPRMAEALLTYGQGGDGK